MRTVNNNHLYRRTGITEVSGATSIAAWAFAGSSRVATVTLANGVVTTYMNNAATQTAVQPGTPNPAWGDDSTDRLGYDGAGRMIAKRHLI